jgi:hypothetical protein
MRAIFESVIYVDEGKWTYSLVKNTKWKPSISAKGLKVVEAGSVYQSADFTGVWII